MQKSKKKIMPFMAVPHKFGACVWMQMTKELKNRKLLIFKMHAFCTGNKAVVPETMNISVLCGLWSSYRLAHRVSVKKKKYNLLHLSCQALKLRVDLTSHVFSFSKHRMCQNWVRANSCISYNIVTNYYNTLENKHCGENFSIPTNTVKVINRPFF